MLRKRTIRLIILVARGSSDNAAQFGRYLLEIATGIPVFTRRRHPSTRCTALNYASITPWSSAFLNRAKVRTSI